MQGQRSSYCCGSPSRIAVTPVTQISGSERQFVLIARALVQDAPAMILNEPASSLDFGNRERLFDGLAALVVSGLGPIPSMHEPAHAARLATRILTINLRGQVATGPCETMLSPQRLVGLYDLPVVLADRAGAFS